ncbi:hypothetical protein [Caminibacter pacificus]
MMKYKSVKLLVKEEIWKNFEEKALLNGRGTHNLIISFIESYIRKHKNLQYSIQKEEYEILTNIKGNYQYYKISLTKEEIKIILNDARIEYELEYLPSSRGNAIPFLIFAEDYKYLYIISKLIKKLYGEDWGFIRQQEGVYQLLKGSLIHDYFNAFIFNEEGELVSGNSFDLGFAKSSL